jgi:hypothetical protein
VRANLIVGPRQSINPVVQPANFGVEVAIERRRAVFDLLHTDYRIVAARGIELTAVGQLQISASYLDLRSFKVNGFTSDTHISPGRRLADYAVVSLPSKNRRADGQDSHKEPGEEASIGSRFEMLAGR